MHRPRRLRRFVLAVVIHGSWHTGFRWIIAIIKRVSKFTRKGPPARATVGAQPARMALRDGRGRIIRGERGNVLRDSDGARGLVVAGSERARGAADAAQVRKTPSWPRSWVNFSLL